MKRFKKLTSLLLALVMVCAMSVTAFADDGYTITISNSTDDYTYVAYQIFAGDLSTEGDTLSNITWGSGIDSSDEDLQVALTEKYGTTDAAVIAAKITTAAEAAALAEIVANYVTTGTTSTYSEEDNNYTISVSAAGYYLVVNTVVPSGDYAYSDYIMEVVTDVTVSPKSTGTPDFDKSVGSEDTTTDDATEDYAIGDSVPFTLTATMPTSYSAYTTYKLVFTDTLSNGLTYNADSLTVTVVSADGTSTLATLIKDTDYTVSTSTDDDGNTTVVITIADLKTSVPSAVAGCKVVVSYTAELNDDATSIENNTAKLSFSNNPNGDSMGTTEEDKTYVVTFTVEVKKTDKDGADLSGAGFTLYKYVGTNVEGADDEGYIAVGEEITDVTTFTFDGLAIGTYKLVETTTPDGYNTADPIEFTITAEAVADATKEDGVDVTITSVTDFTISAETLTTTVINYAGSELPSTGGIGTTIFYVVGTIMVLGAVVVLITRKRMSAE